MPMNFSRESMEGPQPVQDGWYTLILKDFKPSFTKDTSKPKTINLNPIIEFVNLPEMDGRRVFENMSTNGDFAQSIILALIHATGLDAVQTGAPDGGWTFPGILDGMDQHPDNPEQWKYLGPLTNKIFEAELYVDEFNGRKNNKIAQYKCAVPGCTIAHPTNLRRRSK